MIVFNLTWLVYSEFGDHDFVYADIIFVLPTSLFLT
jgi:hypothetical protein